SWSGVPFYAGLTNNKNTLGYTLLVFGLFFVSSLVTRRNVRGARLEFGITAICLVMVAWLLNVADSKTALIALMIASAVAIGVCSRSVRRHFGTMMIVFLIAATWFQLFFDFSEGALTAVGRDPSLTGRTDIWAAVLPLATNPLFGTGFESFWLGDRFVALSSQFSGLLLNQAHNGYIEMYLNLGWVGLLLWSGVLLSFYGMVRKKLMAISLGGIEGRDEIILAK